MKKIIVLAFVAMMVFGPVVNVLAVDGDPSAVDTIQLGDPKVSETVNEPDFFSSIAKFFDTLIPMVPWALLASVILLPCGYILTHPGARITAGYGASHPCLSYHGSFILPAGRLIPLKK